MGKENHASTAALRLAGESMEGCVAFLRELIALPSPSRAERLACERVVREMEELGYPAASSLTEALSGADCAIIAVGHSKFRELGLRVLKDLMAEKAAIVDAAGLVEPDEARRQGFAYRGFGRPHGP